VRVLFVPGRAAAGVPVLFEPLRAAARAERRGGTRRLVAARRGVLPQASACRFCRHAAAHARAQAPPTNDLPPDAVRAKPRD
jgi:hypothetical protein